MRAGWGERLRAAVQRGDSCAGKIAEVVVVEDSDIRSTRAEWTASTRTNVSVLGGGGVALTPSSTARITHTTATDATDITRLTNGTPFDGILIEWSGDEAPFRELRNFTARLHPQVNGGNPKTVAYWTLEVYRVTRVTDQDLQVELIKRRTMDASGTVASDVTFDLAGFNGQYPRVGPAPSGTGLSRPMTVIRIVATQDDGTIADNISWVGSSTGGNDQSGTGYTVTHYTFNDLPPASGVTEWFYQDDRTDLPRFTLNEATYSDGDVEFTSANDFDALTGSGDIVVVLRGSEPDDSAIRGFIWDGSAYVRCYDGDVVGENNEVTIDGQTFGGDLSGVSTTGPWDMRVYLDTSTDALSTPIVRDFGLERVTRTNLAGAARVTGGGQRISDLTTLKGNIAAADIEIAKSGEKDYDDYGSRIFATKHIGQMEVRVWIGDLTGTELARSEWMLHSVWEIENYVNLADAHRLRVVSPLRRLRKIVPPFIVTGGGPDGTRTAVEYNDDIFAVWSDIVDTLLELPARYVGPGPSDETTTIAKVVRKSDGKNELDAVSYLDGGTNIESQGKVRHVRVLHDDPADEQPVFRLPLGSYTPLEIGPGFDARTDEFFVKYNYSEASQSFEDERRHFNAAALTNLGGAGLNTTQELRDEVAQWIRTSALADSVGRRVVNHFGTGEILWHVRPMERMPHLEIGDVGTIETDLFVARTPITERELRGRLNTLCIVVGVDDIDGSGLWLWVPSYELMTVTEAASTLSGFADTPEVTGLETTINEAGEAVVSVQGDKNTANIYVTVGDGTTPSDPTSGANDGSLSGRTGSISTGVAITTGKAAIVKAVAADSGAVLGTVKTGTVKRSFGVIHADGSQRDTNSSTETTLETVTVPGGAMGTVGAVRVVVFGTFQYASGDTFTLRVKFDGTTIATYALTPGADREFKMEVYIANQTASSQRIAYTVTDNDEGVEMVFATPTTVATASDRNITITGQLATGGGLDEIQLLLTTVELMGAVG